MASPGKAIGLGILLWLVVFAVAFAIFPIRESWRALFESIMPLTIALATVTLCARYFRTLDAGFAREGARLGGVWLVVNVVIDLPLLLGPSPMQMTAVEYAGDIGVTYLMIPVITTAMGAMRDAGAG